MKRKAYLIGVVIFLLMLTHVEGFADEKLMRCPNSRMNDVISNSPPQINGSLNAGGFVNQAFTWDYSFYVYDPDDDTITATSDDPEHISWDELVATFNYTEAGNYSVSLTFTDPQGGSTTESAMIKIVEREEIDFIRAAGGVSLKENDGHIDVNKTIEALKKVYANAFVLTPAYQKQWEDIINFLPEAQINDIKVFLILPDARHGVGPCGCGEEWWWNLPKPYCKDYVAWIEALANLSLQYPILKGVFIDDFECGASCYPESGFTVEYIEEVMQAKNAINPNFKFLPGIYLPRGLSDFEIGQNYYCDHYKTLTLTANVNYAGEVDEAYFEIITSGYRSEYFVEQVLINGEIKFERTLGSPHLTIIDLSDYDLSNLTIIKYKLNHTGWVNYLDWLILPGLFINGEKVELTWEIEGDDCYSVKEYYVWLKQYYDLTDGVIFWANSFDLIEPENEIIERLLDLAKERVGEDKIVFGHFYGAEPWKDPVFPSEYYFDTFAKITIQKTDSADPWYPFLLPYYLNYSSGIYSQPENGEPSYDYRFYYPSYTSYDLGFYQGVETEIKLPENISDINISFEIKDDYNGESYYRRWAKELVVKSEEFELNFSCLGENCLWFKENGTLWWDLIAGDEGDQEIFIPYNNISEFISPNENVTFILRMRADEFRGAGSAPPTVNVYVTKPVIVVNGEEIPADWSFISGNALENLWFNSSEKIKELYEDIAHPPSIDIAKPKERYLYIFNRGIIPFPITIIIGKITIEVDAYDESGIDRVEFYVDNILKSTKSTFPYEWQWKELAVGKHEIEVKTYDNAGNMATDEIEVIIFNLGIK